MVRFLGRLVAERAEGRGNRRPDLCPLWSLDHEAHFIFRESQPGGFSDGAEGLREFCGSERWCVLRWMAHSLVKVLMFLTDVLKRISSSGCRGAG